MKKKILLITIIFILLFIFVFPAFTVNADSKKPNIVYWQDFNAKQSSTALSSHSVTGGNVKTNEVSFVDSYSNYGAAIKWNKSVDALSDLNIYAPKAPNATDIEALGFWVEVDNTQIENNVFCFFLYDEYNKSGNGRECWYIKQEPQIVYAMDESTMKPEALTTKNRNISLPAGFRGWVLIPTASMGLHSGYATDNGVLDYSEIANIHIRIHNHTQLGNFYFDEFLFTRNINEFFETMGADMTEIYNYYVINDFENGDITSKQTNSTSVLNLTPKSTKLKLNDEFSAEYNSLHVKSNGEAKIKVFNRLDDTSVLTGGHFSFWIKNKGNEFYLNPKYICDSDSYTIKTENLSTDYYLLSNMIDGKSYAYTTENGEIYIPKEFDGYVTITADAVSPNGFDTSKLESIEFSFGESEFYIDNITFAENLYLYITDDLNCYLEKNLIFANNWAVSVNDTLIHYHKKMDSKEFFDSLAVRRGYRAVLVDNNGDFIHGYTSDLSSISGVYVLSGGNVVTKYNLKFLPTAGDDDKITFVYIIVIAAILLSAVTAVILNARKNLFAPQKDK